MASLATLGYAAHVAALASVSVLVNKIVPEPYLVCSVQQQLLLARLIDMR